MKKKNVLLILVNLIFVQLCFGQILNPPYLKKEVPYCDITKIERSDIHTIVYFKYTAPTEYINGGWVNVAKEFFIRDTNTKKKFQLIKANNIPIGPQKHQFDYSGQILEFNLVFEPLPISTSQIDVIENEDRGGFNFFGVDISTSGANVIEKVKSNESLNCDEIKYVKGQNYTSKPDINTRLNGCKNIYVAIPKDGTFAWSWFTNYLANLGLHVIEVPVRYENKTTSVGSVNAVITQYKSLDFFNGDVNDLCAVLSLVYTQGVYVSGQTATINIVDPYNSFSWDFQFDIPNTSAKYLKKLQNEICTYRVFNPSAVVIAPQRITCWNESSLKQNFINIDNQIEGIYENSTTESDKVLKYKLAVKKMSGKYVLIYLSGAGNTESWKEGEIKATLLETSTPNFYKANWIMSNKSENQNFYISFDAGIMNVIDPDKIKDVYIKMYPLSSNITTTESAQPSTGSGFAIASNGLIVTNFHVIENAKTINVKGVNDDFVNSYSAKVIASDKNNDLAIIQINDSRFTSLHNIPYNFRTSSVDVGENLFVLGYPLTASMGEEIKLTTGVISSKSGYQGDITTFQISAPVQAGNSGAPVFDKNGSLIAIVNAKHSQAENAGYAIKASYLRALIESLPNSINLPTTSTLINKQLTEQVKQVKKFVYIIEVN